MVGSRGGDGEKLLLRSSEMVIMTGMWSEVVVGSGVKWILWNLQELGRAMSGEVEQLMWIRFGKSGLRYWNRFLRCNWASVLPTILSQE